MIMKKIFLLIIYLICTACAVSFAPYSKETGKSGDITTVTGIFYARAEYNDELVVELRLYAYEKGRVALNFRKLDANKPLINTYIFDANKVTIGEAAFLHAYDADHVNGIFDITELLNESSDNLILIEYGYEPVIDPARKYFLYLASLPDVVIFDGMKINGKTISAVNFTNIKNEPGNSKSGIFFIELKLDIITVWIGMSDSVYSWTMNNYDQ